MANVTQASNSSAISKKWFPYYYKPFKLGRATDGLGSTDGGIYITQTSGTTGTITDGVCLHSHNCGYWYEIECTHGTFDRWIVNKYDSGDNLIDTIYGYDNSGTLDDWDLSPALVNALITIDVGVAIRFGSATSMATGNKWKIVLPTFEEMEKRKIYHGGYSTFLPFPSPAGTSTHSDIIPTSLKGKDISVSFNPPIFTRSTTGGTGALSTAGTETDEIGNIGATLTLAWSVDKNATHGVASNGTYNFGSGEEWAFGKLAIEDAHTWGSIGVADDFPLHANLTHGDVSPTLGNTGTVQNANISTSNIQGHAKIRLEFQDLAGGEAIPAAGQFWPCILTIS
jgi:hypothetical protein